MLEPGYAMSALPLAVAYFIQFLGVGVMLPFFPGWLRAIGASPSEIGVLLSLAPVATLFAPTFWGRLADRSGRPGRVFVALTMGTGAFLALLLSTHSLPAVALILCGHALFSSAITTILDAMTLHHVQQRGQRYASVRVFGSVGFVVAAFGVGRAFDVIDDRLLWVPLVSVACSSVWAFLWFRGVSAPSRDTRVGFEGVRELLRDKFVVLLLGTCTLHWIACGPWHTTLALYVEQLGLPTRAIGSAAAIAVLAEVLLFTLWPRLSHRISPIGLLLAAFGGSSVRWLAMAYVTTESHLLALSVLHGLTFGAYYLGVIELMTRRIPGSLRATGQSLLVATNYGIGGIIGATVSGVLFEALGGRRLFQLAAVGELLPLCLALLLARNFEGHRQARYET